MCSCFESMNTSIISDTAFSTTSLRRSCSDTTCDTIDSTTESVMLFMTSSLDSSAMFSTFCENDSECRTWNDVWPPRSGWMRRSSTDVSVVSICASTMITLASAR